MLTHHVLELSVQCGWGGAAFVPERMRLCLVSCLLRLTVPMASAAHTT